MMLEKLKTDFYALLVGLGYNITDNGAYVENFPWLMLRLGTATTNAAVNSTTGKASLVLDIFSTYAGEKEVLQIAGNIENHLEDLMKSNPNILYCNQKSFKILDDKSTGPVRKHGVVNYEFLLGKVKSAESEVPSSELE
jgi:hypothetical protein